MENFIIHDIISQFMPMKNDESLSFFEKKDKVTSEKIYFSDESNESKEEISKISYNDYYINQGVDYIKRNVKLNDPLMNLIFEEESNNLKTPLDEWQLKDFQNNNLDNNNNDVK